MTPRKRFEGRERALWVGDRAGGLFPILDGHRPLYAAGSDADFAPACQGTCEAAWQCHKWTFNATKPGIGGSCYSFPANATERVGDHALEAFGGECRIDAAGVQSLPTAVTRAFRGPGLAREQLCEH